MLSNHCSPEALQVPLCTSVEKASEGGDACAPSSSNLVLSAEVWGQTWVNLFHGGIFLSLVKTVREADTQEKTLLICGLSLCFFP